MDDKIRGYRDEIDVDEMLDLIRIATRKKAHDLFLAALDDAYSQGRMNGAEEACRTFDDAMRSACLG